MHVYFIHLLWNACIPIIKTCYLMTFQHINTPKFCLWYHIEKNGLNRLQLYLLEH